MRVLALDHVQLAMPAGDEPAARAFYGGILGFEEVEKPVTLQGRGGCWFEAGHVRVHLGVEAGFQPARKAHPCFVVEDWVGWMARFSEADVQFEVDDAIPGVVRGYVWDPFGNRIEIMAG